jgi:hypothetical protein
MRTWEIGSKGRQHGRRAARQNVDAEGEMCERSDEERRGAEL